MSHGDKHEAEIHALYHRLLDAWNRCSGEDFSAVFSEDGEAIGFDGSNMEGRAGIAAETQRIFDDHTPGAYVGKIRSVRMLGPRAAVLRAVAGMVPAGQSDLEPELNAVQALVAEQRDDRWRVVLYQNTPAQFHGRPELAEDLTQELRAELRKVGG